MQIGRRETFVIGGRAARLVRWAVLLLEVEESAMSELENSPGRNPGAGHPGVGVRFPPHPPTRASLR